MSIMKCGSVRWERYLPSLCKYPLTFSSIALCKYIGWCVCESLHYHNMSYRKYLIMTGSIFCSRLLFYFPLMLFAACFVWTLILWKGRNFFILYYEYMCCTHVSFVSLLVQFVVSKTKRENKRKQTVQE